MQQNLLSELEEVEQLAKAGRWRRFLHRPFRYASALLWMNLIYPLFKKGKFRTSKTFFDTDMDVLLPAGMDIYLLGSKTHDSEIRLTRWLLKHLEKGQLFVDVGAHFGFFSLLAAHLVESKGRVLSFEAASSTFQLLSKNTNSATNITALHRAVSNEKGSLTFYEFPVLYSEYNTLHPEQFKTTNWTKQAQKVQVEAIILDDYFKENELNPNCIKIDVEGAEENVLKGLEKHLKTQNPTLIVEATRLNITTHLSMQAYLSMLGYFPFRIKNDGQIERIKDIKTYLNTKNIDSDNFVFKKV